MRSLHSRISLALVVATVLAAMPVSIHVGAPASAERFARLLAPGPLAWADDDDDIDIDIDDIEKVKRGEKRVLFRANVKESDLVCSLRVKYADGDVDTVGNDQSDKKGFCEIRFDVPDRKSVIGDATAKLKVETQKGSDRGDASRNFSIRGRRGDF